MNATKDRRLVEALDYIDEEYIASAAMYKMNDLPATQEPPEMTWRTPFKHWKQFVALAASLILLSMAFPVVTRFVSSISDFFAGRGSEMSGSDSLSSVTTGILPDTTIAPMDDSSEKSHVFTNTESKTTEETVKTVLDISPDYWHFIPELEVISYDEMIAVQKAWEEYYLAERADYYYRSYTQNYGDKEGYTDEKILEMVKEEVEKLYQSMFVKEQNNYFHSRRFRSKGYLGKFGECIVLYDVAGSAVIWDRQPQMIGSFDIYYDVYYIYRDGKIYALQDAYNSGYITDEHMIVIIERKEIYKPLALSYVPSDYESIKDINKPKETE